jgi:hypothetical protein
MMKQGLEKKIDDAACHQVAGRAIAAQSYTDNLRIPS